MSFHEARSELGGHELTARINVLAVARPDASLEQKIDKIEEKRSKDEGNIFKQVRVPLLVCFVLSSGALQGCVGNGGLDASCGE